VSTFPRGPSARTAIAGGPSAPSTPTSATGCGNGEPAAFAARAFLGTDLVNLTVLADFMSTTAEAHVFHCARGMRLSVRSFFFNKTRGLSASDKDAVRTGFSSTKLEVSPTTEMRPNATYKLR
jgi:hypothetical protein